MYKKLSCHSNVKVSPIFNKLMYKKLSCRSNVKVSPIFNKLMYKKLSCRREAARCFEFVCSQLQHTAQFFITSYCGFRFTSA